jgi:uncharacterized protein (UPF0335 family)
MKRCVIVLCIALFATATMYGQAKQRPKQRETWYEQALRSINPNNTDFGAIWEQRKRAILDQIGNRYFEYSFAATTVVIILLTVLCVLRVSQKRSLDLAAQSIADVLRHDEYSRQVAREAIRRYNEHIEKCNRMVEADASGLWKWISSAELEAVNSKMQRLADDLSAAREEVKDLKAELNDKSAVIADMSLRSKGAPGVKPNVPPAHVERINQLELELNQEKKKNLRVKGTGLDVRDN